MNRLRAGLKRWWTERWRETKPTDIASVVLTLASVVLTLGSVGLAWVALDKANQATTQQREQEAPVLAPGTPLESPGKRMPVVVEYATVKKRADRLFLDRRVRRVGDRWFGRFVIPLRNGGAGIALTVGLPVLVADCEEEPAKLPDRTIGLLGTYLIPTGGADQLGYLQPDTSKPRFKPGTVSIDGKSLWFNFDYQGAKRRPNPLNPALAKAANLLIWYTDGGQRKLRWTCVSYRPQKKRADGTSEWAVVAQIYGSRSWPPGIRRPAAS